MIQHDFENIISLIGVKGYAILVARWNILITEKKPQFFNLWSTENKSRYDGMIKFVLKMMEDDATEISHRRLDE